MHANSQLHARHLQTVILRFHLQAMQTQVECLVEPDDIISINSLALNTSDCSRTKSS